MNNFNSNAELPPNVVPVPRWTLALHAIQMVFAIVILGLDAYGIRWIPYNALIYSLVVCICTLGVAFYLLVTQLFLHKLYHGIVALAFHVWMLIFWLVDLGLVANLARLWSAPTCTYYYGYGYSCSYARRGVVVERALETREETTTYTAYYGALAAGAVFAAVQLVTWVVSAVILAIHFNKQRTNAGNANMNNPHQPPQYTPANNGGDVAAMIPMEKYNHQATTTTTAQQTPQPQYAQPVQYHHQQQQQQQQNFAPPHVQDPVPRQDTVSPVSQVGYNMPPPNGNVSELSSSQQQYTGAGTYPANVSELSSPQHTGNAAYGHNATELPISK